MQASVWFELRSYTYVHILCIVYSVQYNCISNANNVNCELSHCTAPSWVPTGVRTAVRTTKLVALLHQHTLQLNLGELLIGASLLMRYGHEPHVDV